MKGVVIIIMVVVVVMMRMMVMALLAEFLCDPMMAMIFTPEK